MDKKKLSEADICDKFITPAIQQAGWDTVEQIFREYTLRPGRVVVRGKQAARDKRSLPPLAEQSRIIARVESLLSLCVSLRKSLTASRATQSDLAESLVAEVV